MVHEFAAWLQATPVSVTLQSIRWIIPLLQSIHIVMIGIVFISSLMLVLRVLGRLRADEPFALVWKRFAPWMWSGLVVMACTGIVLVLAEPIREFTALSFWLKMGLLAIAVLSILGFTLVAHPARLAGATQFSTGTRAAAVAMVVIWLAIIFLGRAIAYDVEVWGALSPNRPG